MVRTEDVLPGVLMFIYEDELIGNPSHLVSRAAEAIYNNSSSDSCYIFIASFSRIAVYIAASVAIDGHPSVERFH